ncbi:MAG TPA: hypothetical protein VGA40_00755 [Candidatus Acidoferrales bacterium]
MYTCRECERPVNQATEVCPYCGADLTAPLESATPAKKPNLLRVLAQWSVVIAAMWLFLWFILPERGDPAARAESAALGALREVHSALAIHADAHGGFPATLDTVADRVRSAAQRAQAEGYVIEYAPAPVSAEGQIRSYALLARAGRYGHRNFYVDESGVMRATPENRPATLKDPPVE